MGTIMKFHRYSPVELDWDSKKYIVDQTFIDRYGNIDPKLPTGTVYDVGRGLLEVYVNGQLIHSDDGYIEIDENHIQLALSTEEIPYELIEGDVIYIKVYKNQYCSRGQATVSGTEFYELKKEIVDARQFKDTDEPFDSLDDRLDYIQRQLEMAHVGESDVNTEYEYNEKGQIIREIISGDYTIVRELDYYESGTIEGELRTETVYYADNDGHIQEQVTKGYVYDPVTRRLIRTTVRATQV